MGFIKADRDEAFEDLRKLMEQYERPPKDLLDRLWWTQLHLDCQAYYDKHNDPMLRKMLITWAAYVEDAVHKRLEAAYK